MEESVQDILYIASSCIVIGTKPLHLYTSFTNTISLLESSQPSNRCTELTFPFQSLTKNLAFSAHMRPDTGVPSAHLLNHWRRAASTSLIEDLFMRLQLEGPALLTQSLTDSINISLLFFVSCVVCIPAPAYYTHTILLWFSAILIVFRICKC